MHSKQFQLQVSIFVVVKCLSDRIIMETHYLYLFYVQILKIK